MYFSLAAHLHSDELRCMCSVDHGASGFHIGPPQLISTTLGFSEPCVTSVATETMSVSGNFSFVFLLLRKKYVNVKTWVYFESWLPTVELILCPTSWCIFITGTYKNLSFYALSYLLPVIPYPPSPSPPIDNHLMCLMGHFCSKAYLWCALLFCVYVCNF